MHVLENQESKHYSQSYSRSLIQCVHGEKYEHKNIKTLKKKCKLLTKHNLNHMKTLQPSNTVRFQAQNSSFPTHETAGAHEPPLDGSKKNNK